jgi:hypothetical protein
MFIKLTATSFGHNGYHQAMSQKLKNADHIVKNRQFILGPSFKFLWNGLMMAFMAETSSR